MLRISHLQRLYSISSIKKSNLNLWPNPVEHGYPEFRKVVDQIEKQATVDYKVYPYLPHQDPKSKSYVASQLDEYHDKVQVEAYNNVVSQFQHDLKVQREVWAAIDNLERTYKNGKRGVNTNLKDIVDEPKLQDLGFKRANDDDCNLGFKNEDGFIANTVWESKYKPQTIREWQIQYLNRPVTKHYHPDKGYKYDVPLKPEQKYEYLADRLGHPQFFGTPLDRLLKLQKQIYHPNFIDQPFIQTPSIRPHQSLTFQQGQVIYENANLQEWINFWKFLVIFSFGFLTIWVNYQFFFKNRMTEELLGKTKMIWMKSPKADRKKREKARKNIFRLDRFRVLVLVGSVIIPGLTFAVLRLITRLTRQYIVKMSYSIDKELVFLKRVGTFGKLQQEVIETAHLECPPPVAISRIGDLSSQDPNGIWRLTNLASVDYLDSILLYNNDKYWNPKLKDEFLRGRLGLWSKSVYGYNRQQAKDILSALEKQVDQAHSQKALPTN